MLFVQPCVECERDKLTESIWNTEICTTEIATKNRILSECLNKIKQ